MSIKAGDTIDAFFPPIDFSRFPKTDGETMAETQAHLEQAVDLMHMLRRPLAPAVFSASPSVRNRGIAARVAMYGELEAREYYTVDLTGALDPAFRVYERRGDCR